MKNQKKGTFATGDIYGKIHLGSIWHRMNAGCPASERTKDLLALFILLLVHLTKSDNLLSRLLLSLSYSDRETTLHCLSPNSLPSSVQSSILKKCRLLSDQAWNWFIPLLFPSECTSSLAPWKEDRLPLFKTIKYMESHKNFTLNIFINIGDWYEKNHTHLQRERLSIDV